MIRILQYVCDLSDAYHVSCLCAVIVTRPPRPPEAPGSHPGSESLDG